MTASYPSLRRPLLAIVLGCAVGIAAGLAAGLLAWWRLGDTGIPTDSNNELLAPLFAVLNALVHTFGSLAPMLNWFAGTWAACVALVLAVDSCQPGQRSVPKAAALAVLVVVSGAGTAALVLWTRGYDPRHPVQLVALLAPALACSAALLLALPALLIGHVLGGRRARRAMPTRTASLA
ncbi:hypothetical protein [Xanthomonas medicagonis]|uniref:hypothetical protein n=1 Tax=Xanthomonas medicagonis TaxID=3160841 RepID=UPI003512A0A8